MEYEKLIDEVRDKLDNYTYTDSTYDDLYRKAASNYDSAYISAESALSAEADRNRRLATGQNALNSKSLSEALALRGLAKSGESSLMKINSAISLNNALAAISAEELKGRSQLNSDRFSALANLSTDIELKKADAIENEKSYLRSRLSELETLQAGEKQKQAELAAETEKWKAELASNIERWQAELAADTEKWRAELAADETEWRAKLSSSDAEWQAKLASNDEKWRSELKAGETEWRTKLEAEITEWREKLKSSDAEWQAKLKAEEAEWRAKLDASSSESGKSGGDGGADDEPVYDFTPKIAAKDAAETIIERCTGGSLDIYSPQMKQKITNELIDLISGSKISDEYLENLLFNLRSHGYDIDFDISVAREPFMAEAIKLYQDYYEKFLSDYAVEGIDFTSASKKAAEEAKQKRLEFIAKSCVSKNEFEAAAYLLGYTKATVTEYYNNKKKAGVPLYDTSPPTSGIPSGSSTYRIALF